MKRKIYVAGSCKNRVAIRQLMKYIEDFGYEIAVDWTVMRDSVDLKKDVQEDIDKLHECDGLIYCMDGIKSRGKYFELGYATALNKPIGIYFPYTVGSDGNMPGLNAVVEDESVFVKSKMYPIMYTVGELNIWLSNIKKD